MVGHWGSRTPGVVQSSSFPFLTSSCRAGAAAGVRPRPQRGGRAAPPPPAAPRDAYGWPASVGDAVLLWSGVPGAAVWPAACARPALLPAQRLAASRLRVPAHELASDRSATRGPCRRL